MLVALPAATFLLVMIAGAHRSGFRQGFVAATLVCTLGVVGATELLSLPALLRLPGVLAFWLCALALAVVWLWRYGDRAVLGDRMRRLGEGWRGRRPELVGVVAVLALVLLVGILSPPNNWESMAYRLMRVALWIQQGSVEHYPTPYAPQLYHPPLVSYHALHLQILACGDRFANVPDGLALVGCAVVASLVAKELQQPLPVQVAAAVLAATVPMGVLMGSSTQGNVLAAYWLLCFVLLFVQHVRRPSLWRLVCCGCAAGFAVLAKPTAYVLLPSVALVLGLYGVFVLGLRRGAVALVVAAAIAVVLNLGLYSRNWRTFGHPVFAAGERTHLNQRFGPDVLAANLLRNSMAHWALPSAKFNQALLATAADLLGGIPDLPEATNGRPLAYVGLKGRFHEAGGANLLHYWLLAAAALGLLCLGACSRLGRSAALTSCLLAAWLAAVLAFSGLMTWEQWNTRYDVVLFMLGCPLGATFLGRVLHRREWAIRAVCGLFLLASAPFLLLKESAPFMKVAFDYDSLPAEPVFKATRTQAYFNHLGGHSSMRLYVELADRVAAMQPAELGLVTRKWEYAYPLYVLLKERLPDLEVAYYDVGASPSAAIERENHVPEAIVAASQDLQRMRGAASYRPLWTHSSGVALLRRIEDASFRKGGHGQPRSGGPPLPDASRRRAAGPGA